MNCSLVEQCSFFRVFFRGQWLMYYNTCHRGLYTVVSAQASRKPIGDNEACAPATCSFSGFAKNKHWENYSCIEANKAGKEIGDVTQRDHVTH